ncbi:hypothetical protein, partial [Sphingomonas sp. Ag1]|uniref:hypothetical protein n=1 Tax=Sphingomonas sp. Ag1 TaxID=1642949 RepID=UPI000AA66272
MLRQSRASKPVVTIISSPATSTRVQRVRVGGRRCFSTHTDSEISDALKQVQEEIANGLVPVKEAVEEVKQN